MVKKNKKEGHNKWLERRIKGGLSRKLSSLIMNLVAQ